MSVPSMEKKLNLVICGIFDKYCYKIFYKSVAPHSIVADLLIYDITLVILGDSWIRGPS